MLASDSHNKSCEQGNCTGTRLHWDWGSHACLRNRCFRNRHGAWIDADATLGNQHADRVFRWGHPLEVMSVTMSSAVVLVVRSTSKSHFCARLVKGTLAALSGRARSNAVGRSQCCVVCREDKRGAAA